MTKDRRGEGGKLSRRTRNITEHSELTADEYNMLIPLAIRVLGRLRSENVITLDVEQGAHVTVYDLAGKGDWKSIFCDLGVGPMVKISWKQTLAEERDKYKSKISEGTMTEEDEENYKNLRAICKAYTVATNISII